TSSPKGYALSVRIGRQAESTLYGADGRLGGWSAQSTVLRTRQASRACRSSVALGRAAGFRPQRIASGALRRRSAGCTCNRPIAERCQAEACQFVGAFVLRVACMPLHPVPDDLVAIARLIEFLPQLGVLDG